MSGPASVSRAGRLQGSVITLVQTCRAEGDRKGRGAKKKAEKVPGSAGDLAARRRSIQIATLARDYLCRVRRCQQRLVCRFLWRDAAQYNPDILDGLFYIFRISIWEKDHREGSFKGRVCDFWPEGNDWLVYLYLLSVTKQPAYLHELHRALATHK